MEIKTLQELLDEKVVNRNAMPRLPITNDATSVIAIIFPTMTNLTRFIKDFIEPKLNLDLIWSDVLGLGKKGIALLLRKSTFEKHIKPSLP